MIREDSLVMSHRPYAVDLASLDVQSSFPRGRWVGSIPAAWFRRKGGVTVACVGSLWDFQGDEPADAAAFLAAHTDGRYGGTCYGRWDGTRYWGAQEPATIEAHLALLRPMLDNYPDVPAGFDGWWTFHTSARKAAS